MKTYKLTAVLLVAASLLSVTGCGDDNKSSGSATASSTPAEKKSDPGSSDSSDSSGAISDLNKALAELGDGKLTDCITLYTTYGALYAAALGGKDAVATAETSVDELKSKLPSALSDDLDVVALAIKKVGTDGLIKGGEALSTPEYEKADKNISAFFEKTCGSATSGN
jgi:hypothetical protein